MTPRGYEGGASVSTQALYYIVTPHVIMAVLEEERWHLRYLTVAANRERDVDRPGAINRELVASRVARGEYELRRTVPYVPPKEL